MTTSQTTTSPTWNIDYRWNGDKREYFIQVFTSTPHPAEGKNFKGRVAAEEAALQSGLRREAQI